MMALESPALAYRAVNDVLMNSRQQWMTDAEDTVVAGDEGCNCGAARGLTNEFRI